MSEAERAARAPRAGAAAAAHAAADGRTAASAGSATSQARLLTASILMPCVLFVIAQGGLWVLGTVVVVTLLAQREFYGLIEDKGAHPIMGFGLAAGAALPVVAYLGNEYHATVLMTVALLVRDDRAARRARRSARRSRASRARSSGSSTWAGCSRTRSCCASSTA